MREPNRIGYGVIGEPRAGIAAITEVAILEHCVFGCDRLRSSVTGTRVHASQWCACDPQVLANCSRQEVRTRHRAYINMSTAMGTDRIEILKNMLEQDPRSGFVRYGLAMEYVNRGANEQAIEEFETLLSADPDYVAGYFHAGRTLEKLGRGDDARGMYERGIAAARRKGDQHSLSELQAALDMVDLT